VRAPDVVQGIGTAGWRESAAAPGDVSAVRDVVRRQMNNIGTNFFRFRAGLLASRAVMDALWRERSRHRWVVENGPDAARGALRSRESAALVATARWCLASALARPESRAMHRRTDAPGTDPAWQTSIHSGGLDEVWVRRAGLVAAGRSDNVLIEEAS
jgi:succinate dehydrogenase/fumarate reductase flavoprotein subunit